MYCRGARARATHHARPSAVLRRCTAGRKLELGLRTSRRCGYCLQTDETKAELMGVISGYIHKVPEHKTKAVWKEMLAAPTGHSLCATPFSCSASPFSPHNCAHMPGVVEGLDCACILVATTVSRCRSVKSTGQCFDKHACRMCRNGDAGSQG